MARSSGRVRDQRRGRTDLDQAQVQTVPVLAGRAEAMPPIGLVEGGPRAIESMGEPSPRSRGTRKRMAVTAQIRGEAKRARARVTVNFSISGSARLRLATRTIAITSDRRANRSHPLSKAQSRSRS